MHPFTSIKWKIFSTKYKWYSITCILSRIINMFCFLILTLLINFGGCGVLHLPIWNGIGFTGNIQKVQASYEPFGAFWMIKILIIHYSTIQLILFVYNSWLYTQLAVYKFWAVNILDGILHVNVSLNRKFSLGNRYPSTPLLPTCIKVKTQCFYPLKHYMHIKPNVQFPCSSRFVLSLENDLTVRSKTTEMDIKDFSSGSYATIFGDEVNIIFIN